MSDLNPYEEGLANDLAKAQARIEELEKERDRVAAINVNHCRTVNTYVVDNARLADRAKASDAKLAKAVEGLRKLHHAVCGETGFAACVRLDSGLAYPWPALDEADEMTRALLAEIEGEK